MPRMSQPWLVRFKEGNRPRLRLCCFPSGGGGSAAFWPWRTRVPDFVELYAVRLPGRENRIREPCVTDADEAVGHLVRELGLLPPCAPFSLATAWEPRWPVTPRICYAL